MDWWLKQFFLYCERGSDPTFWAEPFNAISNGAFLIAAASSVPALASVRASRPVVPETLLVLLCAIIGIGSFCFHTFATRWAFMFDTGSIAIMSVAYLIYAVRRFLGARWKGTVAAIAALMLGFALVRYIPCPVGLLPITAAAGHPCLNGSLGYLPVIAAMGIIGGLLAVRRHPAGRLLLGAALVFGGSLAVRSVDTEVCALTVLWGRARGTHALWHVLNAVAIYLLLRAAILYGGSRGPGTAQTE